jgi:hypothetical protein
MSADPGVLGLRWGQALRGGLASLPGSPGVSNLNPVVSLRSTTGYTPGCLRHSFG